MVTHGDDDSPYDSDLAVERAFPEDDDDDDAAAQAAQVATAWSMLTPYHNTIAHRAPTTIAM